MEIRFVAGFSPIIDGTAAAHALYRDALGIDFPGGEGDYIFTESLPGVPHFGLWPLADAARSCFGSDEWPDDVPVPQATIEFEVADVDVAARELVDSGHRLLHEPKDEPWGQRIARLLSADGLLVAVCQTPWLNVASTTDRD
ncbi:MAG: hypothetical protein WD377_01795 [Nitriliruptoraceae bacterium]